ncbi:NADPH-dependent FMN reductase [Streptomyces alkaliterrae]|uniref:NADPH-dependent FMN reductase n=1 Tax=Streptomyces alkaliterrae TaxID=2213162 RepID=A0A5P0YPK6_9ACTN|nr:NADPH-dependent FMN reductase [Streptomyces alkaliterrae]MBB1253314.1 NADPH-dependent FMN reductase [Streptomyces alkaliterrae]MBB1259281.1 NADPH-dependent FMN reductase [Streptomyces alkaliterrae]MQS02294.1 NADPH-dependent FMN reductase [Streptomyces alkaliterrae]
MSKVLVISGSPSPTSKTEFVGEHVARRLAEHAWHTGHLRVRELPARALLDADVTDPDISRAVDLVAQAEGIVLATPTYKASFSGLLKVFLDLLPQYGFTHKVVLPLATGGSGAHVLVLDYALRPVAHSLGARHVVQGHFLLDRDLTAEGGRVRLRPESTESLDEVVEQFRRALAAAH